MDRKIIFFDVDGTIVPHVKDHKSIHQIVKEAIKKTREQGHLCFIASGRSKGFLQDDILECGFDGYVLANGAHIVYQGKDIKKSYLDFHETKKLVQLLRQYHVDFLLETDEYYYSDKEDNYLIEWAFTVGAQQTCVKYGIDDYVISHTMKIQMYFDTDEKRNVTVKNLGAFFYEIYPGYPNVEASSKDVTKATGISDIIKLLEFDRKDSICFGDGLNDVEMFKTVGHSIAMGNAREEVKNVADEICMSSAQDGVAYKLKEMFHI